MGRQRTKVACVQCNTKAATYPKNWDALGASGPSTCSMECAVAYAALATKDFDVCGKHHIYVDLKSGKECLKCKYDAEVLDMPPVVTKTKVVTIKPMPVVPSGPIAEIGQTLSDKEWAAKVNQEIDEAEAKEKAGKY